MKKNSLPFAPLQNIKIANDSRSGIKTEAGGKDKVEGIWFESSRRSSGMLFQLESRAPGGSQQQGHKQHENQR